MNILHICLASAFTEGMSYQENLLLNQNIKDGHDVTIISDCNKYIDGNMAYTPPEDRVLSNGIRLIRLEYDKIINRFISSKIRKVSGLYNLILETAPDVILFHGVAGWELLTVSKYKKNHPEIRLYLDSHEDFNNSGTNFISKTVQYRWFNRTLVKSVLPYVDKILCVSYESFDFLRQMYCVPDDKIESYPLGGIVLDDTVRSDKRDKMRRDLSLEDGDILLVHSGKMDKLKRTEELLKAFNMVTNERIKLILIGSMCDETRETLESMILSDQRIKFIGWKSVNELMEYLCACDLYVQPGSQSATMQNALCCGSAVAVFPNLSYKFLLKEGAFYIESSQDIERILQDILRNRDILTEKRNQGFKIAQEVLDYKVLAKRLYR